MVKKISQINPQDRPREKLQAKGAAALADFELLQALIGGGNKQADVSKIAKDTLKLIHENGADITYEQLKQVNGLVLLDCYQYASLDGARSYCVMPEVISVIHKENIIDIFISLRALFSAYSMSLLGQNCTIPTLIDIASLSKVILLYLIVWTKKMNSNYS